MIKEIEFNNFRNLTGRKYLFSKSFNLVFGKNSSGKTNLLEGIKLAFSAFDGSYTKVLSSDFTGSDDSKPIEIKVLLKSESIPSFNFVRTDGSSLCGFKIVIRKTGRGFYRKEFYNYDGTQVNSDIVTHDDKIPTVFSLPMKRVDDIYSDYASIGLDKFIDSETKYSDLRDEFSKSVKKSLDPEIKAFKEISKKYGQDFEIEINGSQASGEKIYIIDGEEAHGRSIGSGYRSIANIILNVVGGGYSIMLIDEIENHLHPPLLRTLIEELSVDDNVFVVATTHSAVAINQVGIGQLIDIGKGSLKDLILSHYPEEPPAANKIIAQLDTFLHPGLAELMLSDNVIVVEGFSEELVLRNYITSKALNLTIVNAHGIMFEPYLVLSCVLGNKTIAMSDNDRSLSTSGNDRTTRFNNLSKLCRDNDIKIIEVNNTFESDIYINGFCGADKDLNSLLRPHKKHTDIMVAKRNSKTTFAAKLVDKKIDLSEWHIMKSIENELKSS